MTNDLYNAMRCNAIDDETKQRNPYANANADAGADATAVQYDTYHTPLTTHHAMDLEAH